MALPNPAEKSLYERLGGYDALCAATDDLLARVQSDPQLKDFWKGSSNATRRRGRQLLVDFLVEAAGGPAFYTGQDMKTAHAGMQISESDWNALIRHTTAMLEHFQVAAKEQEDVLAFLASLKADIIEKM